MKSSVTNPEPDRFPEPVKHKSNLATIYRTRNRSAIRYEVRWHDDAKSRWLTQAASLDIVKERLTWNGRSPSAQTLPKLFSHRFVERLHWALERGQVSVRRAAELLDVTVEDLEDRFKSHRFSVPFDV